MCGIVALSNGDVAYKLYYGLYSIQHRGQDSCGITTYDPSNKRFRMRKKQGLVSNVFSKQEIENLYGQLGIGHVRYPTIGGDFERDAQPFVYNKEMTLAHNGNIANYMDVVKGLNIKPGSMCDSEAVMNLLAQEMKSEGGLMPGLEAMMNKLNGAYSVVAIIPGEGLVIFRDPHAIRPLILSKHGAASESVALDIMGEEVVDDVKPGECVVIKDGEMERKTILSKEPRHCMFEWVYFSRPDSTIENKSVYRVRLRLGKELAKQWDHDVDVVMPVPDTARATALRFARAIDVPFREGLIKNRYVGRTFIMPAQELRETAVKLKLNPIIREIKDKRVAVVDDSIVRGTTSRKIVKLIRDAGAKEVHFVVACPPIKWPCFYGIDMTKKSELAASKYEDVEKEMAEKIGADSVTYLTVKGLRRAIGLNGLCTACLDGNYPTDVSALLEKKGEERPYEVDE
ncbi:amidophosphoribosyltransferase [archaeon]